MMKIMTDDTKLIFEKLEDTDKKSLENIIKSQDNAVKTLTEIQFTVENKINRTLDSIIEMQRQMLEKFENAELLRKEKEAAYAFTGKRRNVSGNHIDFAAEDGSSALH